MKNYIKVRDVDNDGFWTTIDLSSIEMIKQFEIKSLGCGRPKGYYVNYVCSGDRSYCFEWFETYNDMLNRVAEVEALMTSDNSIIHTLK